MKVCPFKLLIGVVESIGLKLPSNHCIVYPVSGFTAVYALKSPNVRFTGFPLASTFAISAS